MKVNVSFKVSWARTGEVSESRTITDQDDALNFYEGLVGDPKVESACVVESTEREIRFFEREARAGHPRREPVGSDAKPAVVKQARRSER